MNLDEILHTPLGSAIGYVKRMIRANLIPYLHGSPAIGKSAIMHAVADELNLCLIDLRFAGFDPTDLQGFPAIDYERGLSRYYPMETFPLDDWELPIKTPAVLDEQGNEITPAEYYSGWLVFCDELSSAPPAVQAASYKLFLDRQVGQRHLHPAVHLAAAGNLETDGAIVQPMSTALISRLNHMVVTVDYEFWMKWAEKGNVNSLITSFLRYQPDSLYTFDANNPDQPYASPRTWEFTNTYLKAGNGDPRQELVPMAGFLNIKPAQDLITFANCWATLPKYDEVIADPKGARVPGYDNPGALHALCGAVGDWLKADNIEKLMPYIERIEPDFQTVTLRNAIRRKPDLMATKLIQAWIQKNADVLL